MKKIAFFLVIMTLISCSKDEKIDTKFVKQKYDCIKKFHKAECVKDLAVYLRRWKNGKMTITEQELLEIAGEMINETAGREISEEN